MIIKCLSRKAGTGQLINYLFKEEDKLSNDNHKQIVIKHNLRSRTIKNWAKEFEKNETLRLHKRKDAVAVHHTIISLNSRDKEKVNESMLRNIAKQFINLRGKDSIHLIVAHYNTQAVHLHCLTSGSKYMTGKGNRLSKRDLQKLKAEMTIFQEKKYPQLVNSLPKHGKTNATKFKELPKTHWLNNRISQKEHLIKTLSATYSKSRSREAFLTSLKSKGYEPYYRGSQKQLTGVKDESGLKFRLNRLGYDSAILAKLDLCKEEDKALAELRDIRAQRSDEREQSNERSAVDLEETDTTKDQDNNRNVPDDLEKDDQGNENVINDMNDREL